MCRGLLMVEEENGSPVHYRVYGTAFPESELGERFSAQFSLEGLDGEEYRLADYADGAYLQAEMQGDYQLLAPSRAARFAFARLGRKMAQNLLAQLPAIQRPAGCDDVGADRLSFSGGKKRFSQSGHFPFVGGVRPAPDADRRSVSEQGEETVFPRRSLGGGADGAFHDGTGGNDAFRGAGRHGNAGECSRHVCACGTGPAHVPWVGRAAALPGKPLRRLRFEFSTFFLCLPGLGRLPKSNHSGKAETQWGRLAAVAASAAGFCCTVYPTSAAFAGLDCERSFGDRQPGHGVADRPGAQLWAAWLPGRAFAPVPGSGRLFAGPGRAVRAADAGAGHLGGRTSLCGACAAPLGDSGRICAVCFPCRDVPA